MTLSLLAPGGVASGTVESADTAGHTAGRPSFSGARFHDVRQTVTVQGGHRCRAMGQHGALIDRAFVGDLALVERRRIGEQTEPCDTVGAAGGALGKLGDHP